MGFLVELFTAVITTVLTTVVSEVIKILINPPEPVPPIRETVNELLQTLAKRLFRKITLVYVAAILVLLLASDLTPVRLGETLRVLLLGLPKQERMIGDSFAEFDRQHYQNAIERSRTVIEEYEAAARNEERDLEAQRAPLLKPGKVPVGQVWEAMTVFSHGSLNSVALAWWITGRSHQNLGHVCDAKRAYEMCMVYAYARSWDPQFWPIRGWSPFGWFWSPPDDARARVEPLTCQGERN